MGEKEAPGSAHCSTLASSTTRRRAGLWEEAHRQSGATEVSLVWSRRFVAGVLGSSQHVGGAPHRTCFLFMFQLRMWYVNRP